MNVFYRKEEDELFNFSISSQPQKMVFYDQ